MIPVNDLLQARLRGGRRLRSCRALIKRGSIELVSSSCPPTTARPGSWGRSELWRRVGVMLCPKLEPICLEGVVKSAGRWSVAVLVTVAAFAVGTWVSGAIVLPGTVKDPAIRWSIAAAFGVAVAALAALWGHSFSTREQASDTPLHHNPGTSAKDALSSSGNTRNKISGGNFHGMVIQGRDISGSVSGSNPPQEDSQSGSEG